jgi:hypothetical protein
MKGSAVRVRASAFLSRKSLHIRDSRVYRAVLSIVVTALLLRITDGVRIT